MGEIPDDILETAFALTAGDWDQPHPVRAGKVARAILAERDRCAGIAASYARGYDVGRQIAEEISTSHQPTQGEAS